MFLNNDRMLFVLDCIVRCADCIAVIVTVYKPLKVPMGPEKSWNW